MAQVQQHVRATIDGWPLRARSLGQWCRI